ncbi:MAG: hypothetical protein IJ640_00435 [Prevotella sp.]|nr:hypothetical protein [Prevotella sp.]
MVTNKEILAGRVKRINEKAGTDLVLKRTGKSWYLCRVAADGREMGPSPFSATSTRRTAPEMLEYLRGLEDGVDYYTKSKEL